MRKKSPFSIKMAWLQTTEGPVQLTKSSNFKASIAPESVGELHLFRGKVTLGINALLRVPGLANRFCSNVSNRFSALVDLPDNAEVT